MLAKIRFHRALGCSLISLRVNQALDGTNWRGMYKGLLVTFRLSCSVDGITTSRQLIFDSRYLARMPKCLTDQSPFFFKISRKSSNTPDHGGAAECQILNDWKPILSFSYSLLRPRYLVKLFPRIWQNSFPTSVWFTFTNYVDDTIGEMVEILAVELRIVSTFLLFIGKLPTYHRQSCGAWRLNLNY